MAKLGKKVKIDFSDAEVRIVCPEGERQVEVASVEMAESNAGNDYLKWKFKVINDADPKINGATLYCNTSLQPKALWNLRGMLIALGYDVPQAAVDLDLESLVGYTMTAQVEHEEYEGKIQAKITDYAPAADGDAPEATVKDDTKAAKATKKEPEVEKIAAEEVTEMDVEELEALIEKHSLEVNLSEMKTMRKKANAVIDALESKGLIEQE